ARLMLGFRDLVRHDLSSASLIHFEAEHLIRIVRRERVFSVFERLGCLDAIHPAIHVVHQKMQRPRGSFSLALSGGELAASALHFPAIEFQPLWKYFIALD